MALAAEGMARKATQLDSVMQCVIRSTAGMRTGLLFDGEAKYDFERCKWRMEVLDRDGGETFRQVFPMHVLKRHSDTHNIVSSEFGGCEFFTVVLAGEGMARMVAGAVEGDLKAAR